MSSNSSSSSSSQRRARRHTHTTLRRKRERPTSIPGTISLKSPPPRRTARARAHLSKNASTILLLASSLCLASLLRSPLRRPDDRRGRRSLLSSLYLSAHSTLMPWAHHNLVDVSETPSPSDTALFWHIPKSGGTAAKRLYQCMGRTLAHRVGADPKFGHSEEEIVVFEPHKGKDWKVVNVDTTVKEGIDRAARMGLVPSRAADLIFTMEPAYAGQKLYDEDNKGRFLALFRHPVERALSVFYYLQDATWERTYRPEWKNMTVLEWAHLPNSEEDYMIHKLVDKPFSEEVTEVDLIIAKELVRQRFIVGLMEDMEESVRRFNLVLGVDVENDERNAKCMVEFFGEKNKTPANNEENKERTLATTNTKNSNKHPKFAKNTPEYKAIADRNPLDMILFQYIEKLYDEQMEVIDHYFDADDDSIIGNEKEEGDATNQASSPEPEPEVESLTEDARKLPQDQIQIPPQANTNLVSVQASKPSSPSTPFFWHIPKCGGTTLQRLYWCMGYTIANEVGGNPKFREKFDLGRLDSFQPWTGNPGRVLNIDVSTHDGIVDARNKGFLSEEHPPVDFISTPEFHSAYTVLYGPRHKAQMFAMFRHPIERQVSKFFYLRKATWEATYNKKWQKMSLTLWSTKDRGENNWMVRKLLNKSMAEELSPKDLKAAEELIRQKFVIGRLDRYEESLRRFNILLGVDPTLPRNRQCIREFSQNKGSNRRGEKNLGNSYSHPEAKEGSPAWRNLAKLHSYDVALYEFIVKEYERQGKLFEGVDKSVG